MESLEEIKARVEQAIPGARVEIIPNPGPANQPSLLLDHAHAAAVARFLRDDPALRLDLLLQRHRRRLARSHGEEKGEGEEAGRGRGKGSRGDAGGIFPRLSRSGLSPLLDGAEARAGRRSAAHARSRREGAALPSLTPVWRSAEFQEREIFDLYGIRFDGHPDLRRILMWDEFKDFPMRKDYREPDDYEYEPTPHDEVLGKGEAALHAATGTGRRGEHCTAARHERRLAFHGTRMTAAAAAR